MDFLEHLTDDQLAIVGCLVALGTSVAILPVANAIGRLVKTRRALEATREARLLAVKLPVQTSSRRSEDKAA